LKVDGGFGAGFSSCWGVWGWFEGCLQSLWAKGFCWQHVRVAVPSQSGAVSVKMPVPWVLCVAVRVPGGGIRDLMSDPACLRSHQRGKACILYSFRSSCLFPLSWCAPDQTAQPSPHHAPAALRYLPRA